MYLTYTLLILLGHSNILGIDLQAEHWEKESESVTRGHASTLQSHLKLSTGMII